MTTLLVASTGGHLAQLHRLRPRLVPPGEPVVWVTFASPQSKSLLAGEDVVWVPYVAPRAVGAVVRNVGTAWRLLRGRQVRRVVSTGAGVALAYLPLARLLGTECHYIESAARSEGPSLTGRILSRVPGVNLYTQYRVNAGGRWSYRFSVFDDYEAGPVTAYPDVRRVVVTLGTIKPFQFRRLLERLTEILPRDAEVLWQTGATDASGLGIDAVASLPAHELHRAMAEADVVVAHAGIGSALGALDAGRCPVLVPRLRAHGEHVDDHQIQIARELEHRGLALSRSPDDLTLDDLRAAAARTVTTAANPSAA